MGRIIERYLPLELHSRKEREGEKGSTYLGVSIFNGIEERPQVLAAQDQLRIAHQNLIDGERILDVIQHQFSGGTVTQLEVSQQEALVWTQRASIPPLEVALRQNKNALAVLIGRPPENFGVRGGGMAQITVPHVTPGLPSELLYQRPDVREAEAQLASSNVSVESARAAFFPQIPLTGQTGVQSQDLAILQGVFRCNLSHGFGEAIPRWRTL